ncbi:MAG: molybdopterin-containing oxidoreductase family protein, partial [Vicinamibacteria bacterium]
MHRREFLSGSLFAATAGLALDACAPESYGVIPILIPEEPFVPGEEAWLHSTCFECPAGCGLLVRKIDGRLVKVEGNAEDPASRGGVCARGQALPQAMYHPDRIREPLVRDGDRGRGKWKKASWDEALDRIASEISRAAVPVGFLTGQMSGHRGAMVRRFLAAMGGQHLVHEPFTTAPIRRAHELSTGHAALFDLDPAASSYVVSFGAEILESHTSPVRFARGLAEMRQGRPGRRGKFVMVGPRLSLTAANADEWIPARPGSELDLALGAASLILEENLHDQEFAASSTSGLEEFVTLVSERAKVRDVADRTGIPLKRIEKLARELSQHRPAVALAGGSSIRSPQGVALALAVSHLNALLGSYRDLRIANVGPSFFEWPALATEAAAPPRSLAAELMEGEDLPSVLFITDTNPMHSLPSAFGLGERLARCSLVVSFASYPDESSRMADVILPESMAFERFE